MVGAPFLAAVQVSGPRRRNPKVRPNMPGSTRLSMSYCMRATAAGFIFNTPRLISAFAPLFAGTLIVGLGGYGKAATIIGLFYGLGLLAVRTLAQGDLGVRSNNLYATESCGRIWPRHLFRKRISSLTPRSFS